MFIALILADGRFFIGVIDMSKLLALLAKATDTKGYPDDKDPANWRTINHAKVHLDNNGNIDGGAGEKFKGNAWTSENHPFKGAPKPKPPTKEDLDAAWKKVVKFKVAMNQSKSQGTYEKHAKNLQDAIEEYKKLESQIPEGTPKPKHNVGNMEQHAAKPYAPKDPLAGLAEATTPQTQSAPQVDFAGYFMLAQSAAGLMTSLKYGKQYGTFSNEEATQKAKDLINKGFNQENYDKLSLQEKKTLWGMFSSKSDYMNAVKEITEAAAGKSGLPSEAEVYGHSAANQEKEKAINAIKQNINKGFNALYGDGSADYKAALAKAAVDAGLTLENLKKLDEDDIAEIETDFDIDHGTLGVYIDDIEMLAQKATYSLQSSPTGANMGSNGLAGLAAATTIYKAKNFKSKALATLRKIKMLDEDTADNVLCGVIGKVWKKASNEEKNAAFEYTHSYSKYNEPLRGIVYGTGQYVGPGNVDMENIGIQYGGYKPGEVKKKINALTNIIDKCSLPKDMQLIRGCNYSGMDKMLGVSLSWLQNASDSELQSLVGGKATDYGFMSTGCADGKGFDHKDVIMTIYAPKGTKGMYVEPFSMYGEGAKGTYWDGEEKFHYYGGEQEVVLQRSTTLQVKSVKRANGRLYLEMQVVNQDPQYIA